MAGGCKNNGGARKGAGRPKGAKDAAKLAVAKKIAAAVAARMNEDDQITPLEVLLEVMRYHWTIAKGLTEPDELAARLNAMRESATFAEKAAPYLHARLASTVLKGDKDAPLSVVIVDDIGHKNS